MRGLGPGQVRHAPWRGLLRLAALADLAALLAVAVLLRDREALALAILVLIGVGLTRVGGGLPGVVVLALLFADLAFFTLTGATSQILHREEVVDLLIPATIGAISIAGLGAPAALVVEKMNRGAGHRAGRIVVQVALAYFVLTLAAGLLAAGGGDERARPGDLVLRAQNTAFSRTDLLVQAGEVGVYLENRDLFWHTFTVDALGVDLKVPVRGERRMTFRAPAGIYAFYCRVPGHDLAGMKGTLRVVAPQG